MKQGDKIARLQSARVNARVHLTFVCHLAGLQATPAEFLHSSKRNVRDLGANHEHWT